MKDTYKATFQCNICGHKWKKDILKGHRLIFVKNFSAIIKEKDNMIDKEINIEDTKLICEICGCTSGIVNISNKQVIDN